MLLAEPLSCVAAAGNGDLNFFDATRAHHQIGNLLQDQKRFGFRHPGPLGVEAAEVVERTPFPFLQNVLVRQPASSRVEMSEFINRTKLNHKPDNDFMTRPLLVVDRCGILR